MKLLRGILVYICLPTIVNLADFYLLGLNAFPVVIIISAILGAVYLFLLFRYRTQATTRAILLICLLVVIIIGGLCVWIFIRGATLYIDNQPVTGPVVKVDGGSVLVDPPPGNDGKYIRYSKVTLNPVPDDKHRFNQWSDDISGIEPEKTLWLTSDKHASTEFIKQYTVHMSANPDTKGTTYPSPGDYKVDAGATFLAKAIPYQNCRFISWLFNSSTVTTQTLSITVNSDVTLEAGFIRQYQLTNDVTPADGGTIDPAPGIHFYDEGSIVILTPIPSNGFRFDKWLGDASGESPSMQVPMIRDKQIIARFIQQHTLTITSLPINGGKTQPPSGTTYTFDEGQEVIIQAFSLDGYRFIGFSGDITGNSPTKRIVMDRDFEIVAEFIQVFTLTVTSTQLEGGTITPAPGLYFYDAGETVTLTATPADGFRFVSWTGDIVSGDRQVTIVINKNTKVSAHFIRVFKLTVLVNSSQMGSASGSGMYDEGTLVIIDAVPNPGFGFRNWSGDISSSEFTVTIFMIRNMTVTANFAPVVNLMISINPSVGGSVVPAGGPQIKDSEITLKAIPAQGWRFLNWSGDLSGSNPEATIKMTSDKNITANFVKTYNLQVYINPPGSATVSPVSGTYDAGTEVTVTLTPAANYILSSWSGDASGSSNVITVVMDSDKNITANMIFFGDMVRLPDTIHLCTITYNGNAVGNSNGLDSFDGNFESRFGYKNSGGDPPAVREVIVVSEHSFSRPATITQVKYRFYADALSTGEYIREHNILWYIEYFSGGEWHELPNSRYSAGGGEGENGWDSGIIIYTGSLSNVSKIRAYCLARSFITGGEASANSEAWIYEIQAWGN